MLRHPAGKGRQQAASRNEEGKGHHVVSPGDSLWKIAEDVLRTTDPSRVARYWPAIHRANRATIGSNPDLLRPGQILVLPPESPHRRTGTEA